MHIISRSAALRARWHKELVSGNLAVRLLDGSLTEFPPSILQLTTDYLKRKKLRSNTEECNTHLNNLVREHVERHKGSLEVAILACTLEYSPFPARAALISLRGDGLASPSYTKYLRCLILAHSIAPQYVSKEEAQVATTLLHIRLGYADPLLIFYNMISTLATIPSSLMLPSEYINALLIFCQIPASHELYFRQLRDRCRFASLYRAVSWVSEFHLQPQQCRLAHEVLERQIPQLHMWASWRPDEATLQQWEDYEFTPEQTARLRPIFQLEGPDATMSGKATFKEAGPACFQSVQFDPPELSLVQRLFQLLHEALQVGPEAIDLLLKVCVEAPATADSLSFAERVIRVKEPSCCNAAITLSSLTPDAVVGARMTALSSTLPIFHRHSAMREIVAGHIKDKIVPTMEAAQQAFKEQLYGSTFDELSRQIYMYGRAIKHSPWLGESVAFPQGFLGMIDRFPSDKDFDGIMSQLSMPQTQDAEKAFKDYLVATLGGAGTAEEIEKLKEVVDKEQEFWINHPEVERNRILVSICNLSYVNDTDFLHACRRQILVEDVVLLRDLLGLIEKDTNVSCVDMLRILARRLEIPMAVDGVWISLMLLMLQQRADVLLTWACDNLPVKMWISFVSDVRTVFAGLLSQTSVFAILGMTAERLRWWQKLQGEYLEAVHYIDREQRRLSGGIASMRWLYLQEIPHTDALLSVVVGKTSLGFDHQWLLGLLEPSTDQITALCSFIARYDQTGEAGLYCIRAILERLNTASQWSSSATETYVMAWYRSNFLTDSDKQTLALLVELMRIQPTLNPHGLSVIKSEMLQEYDSIIELAREVEGLRFHMARHDNEHAEMLTARLGMRDARPYIDPDIPESLSDAVECVGIREYEICFPLTHLKGHDRKTRGIGSDYFPILVVRVTLQGPADKHGFCVHLAPHETAQDTADEPGTHSPAESSQLSGHTYWRPRTQSRKPAGRLCNTAFNLFTHALAQRMHRHFLAQDVSLQSVHDVVSDTIRQPGSECMACGDPLTGLWKPTICTKDECTREMARSSLLLRAYGLLVDAPVLDFLLGCVYAAAKDGSPLALLTTDCPFDRARLVSVIDSFPALPADETMTPFDRLSKILANPSQADERKQVLAWMSKWFRGCMLSAPPGKRVSVMSGAQQFLLYNSTPECERAFRSYAQAGGAAAAADASRVVFHGAPTPRMWRVLTQGLRNLSNTRYMAHGAANGPGIYLAEEPATSFRYSGQFRSTWSRSAFGGQKVLLGCELIEPGPHERLPPGKTAPPKGTHIVTNESRVLVRYVFIGPSTYPMPPPRHVDTAMRSTFSRLRAGPAV